MGKNFDQIVKELRELGDGAYVQVTLVTNQDDQVASYATGFLYYHRWLASAEQLSNSKDQPLVHLFSDRMIDIDPPGPSGGFGRSPRQPFSANAAAKLGVSFLTYDGLAEEGWIKADPPTIRFTLLSYGNTTFTVELTSLGNVLYGVGQPMGPHTDAAVYVISFGEPSREPVIH